MADFEVNVKTSVTTLASSYNDESDCGINLANSEKSTKPKLYERETGVTGQKKKVTHDKFSSSVKTQLVRGFAKKTFEWQVTLHMFITYGRIKEF